MMTAAADESRVKNKRVAPSSGQKPSWRNQGLQEIIVFNSKQIY